LAIITVSRQFGAGGEVVGRIIAKKLGFLLVNQDVINEGLTSLGLPAQAFRFDKTLKKDVDSEKKRMFYLTALHEFIMDLAAKESIVLLGRGGQFLFQNHSDAFHIRIQAPLELRVQWIQEIKLLDKKEALRLVQEKDRSKKRFTREVFKHSWMDIELFDLVLNTGKLSPQRAAKVATQAYMLRKKDLAVNKDEGTSEKQEITAPEVRFMHPSEEEFARVLDFYKIPWQYEPRTFALQWDSNNQVTEAFSPDFYLPDFNLFVELTTQRQKLVWKKNKKVRRLKELYPDINIKIVYGKDYRSLLKKFGIDED
jgi:cytidylate kinase